MKNPNGGEALARRSPEDIMDEIAALDAESGKCSKPSEGCYNNSGNGAIMTTVKNPFVVYADTSVFGGGGSIHARVPGPTAERTRPRLHVARFEQFENVLPGNAGQRALRFFAPRCRDQLPRTQCPTQIRLDDVHRPLSEIAAPARRSLDRNRYPLISRIATNSDPDRDGIRRGDRGNTNVHLRLAWPS